MLSFIINIKILTLDKNKLKNTKKYFFVFVIFKMRNNIYIINGIHTIISIITIVIYSGILNWLNNVSKCKCTIISNDINFFKITSIIFIIYYILELILFNIYGIDLNTFSKYNSFFHLISIILTILNLTFLIKLFFFIRTLKKNNCHCGLKQQENLIYYYLITLFSLYSLIILLMIISLIFIISTNKLKYTTFYIKY